MSEYKPLFVNDVPLIDVRAPIEFEAGHFPMSTNLPLMNNEERHLVGTKYKESGQAAAIALGHSLVNEEVKSGRVAAWTSFIAANPGAQLYCFRGGLRSQISKQWIKEAGIEIKMIPGGYKALRRFLMETIEAESKNRKFFVISGRTGSGKTILLQKSQSSFLDLERHANHKGSSFGYMGKQPTQITFENRIAVDLLKTEGAPFTLLEDESIMIGSAIVPKVLFQAKLAAPMIVLEKTMEERVSHIVKEYVFDKTAELNGDFNQTYEFMIQALDRIQKRLGGLNHSLIFAQVEEAFQSPDIQKTETHRAWVESLLVHYYDQFYDRALKRNATRIVFQGNEQACIDYLRSQK